MDVTYLRGYDTPEKIVVREVEYDPFEDILVMKLTDYTILFASYLERKESGWVAGISENY